MRTYTVLGIIIKRKNIGEGDRILTVLTRNRGKIQIKAKGVRKITSRRSAHVELLNLAELTIYDNSIFPILTEANSIDNFTLIKNKLPKVGIAYHICELIDGLCAEHQENLEVFELVIDTLRKLGSSEADENLVKEFELELLRKLGFISNNFAPQTNLAIENILERKLKARQILPLLA